MTSRMTKRERLEATFAGEPVDRPAVALWRHWPVDDQRGDELARASLVFQHTFDFDFIKVTPSSNYCVAGYGAETSWVGNQEGTRTFGHRIIKSPEDWERLEPRPPLGEGVALPPATRERRRARGLLRWLRRRR